MSDTNGNDDWPSDINNYAEWPEEVDADYLIDHISSLTVSTFKSALLDEVFDADDTVAVAKAGGESSPDLVTRIQWLQEPLYNPSLWPESWGDGWHEDFLDLMWSIIGLSESTELDEEKATEAVLTLMKDDDIWHCPVGPAAIIAQRPVLSAAVDSVLQTFTDAWDIPDGEPPRYRGSRAIDCDGDAIPSSAPLLAISCLHPNADLDLVRLTARICSETEDGGVNFCVAFWEYVTGCLLPNRSDGDWWCPVVWWRDGFFANGLPADCPPIGNEQLAVLVEYFLGAHEGLHFANVYGEEGTPESATAAFGARSELPDVLLAKLAVVPFKAAKAAVVVNPSASAETRAAAALGL